MNPVPFAMSNPLPCMVATAPTAAASNCYIVELPAAAVLGLHNRIIFLIFFYFSDFADLLLDASFKKKSYGIDTDSARQKARVRYAYRPLFLEQRNNLSNAVDFFFWREMPFISSTFFSFFRTGCLRSFNKAHHRTVDFSCYLIVLYIHILVHFDPRRAIRAVGLRYCINVIFYIHCLLLFNYPD